MICSTHSRTFHRLWYKEGSAWMGPDDLPCSRNARGFVCLVDWSVWFFWMNFRSDQPDRRDRPDEPAFVGRAQWKIDQPPSLE